MVEYKGSGSGPKLFTGVAGRIEREIKYSLIIFDRNAGKGIKTSFNSVVIYIQKGGKQMWETIEKMIDNIIKLLTIILLAIQIWQEMNKKD